MKYCLGEHNIYEEWKSGIEKSSTIKIFLLRGARLFDEVNGFFYLDNISNISNLKNKYFQVLLLDFNNISEEEYIEIKKNYSLDFRGLSHDKELFDIATKNIKTLNKKGYNIEYKLIKPQNLSDKKLIIFDEHIYYTSYKSDLVLHQKNDYYKIDKNNKEFEKLKNVFNSVWISI